MPLYWLQLDGCVLVDTLASGRAFPFGFGPFHVGGIGLCSLIDRQPAATLILTWNKQQVTIKWIGGYGFMSQEFEICPAGTVSLCDSVYHFIYAADSKPNMKVKVKK